MAFHPYPQLIRAVFNPQRFGPPRGITLASAWPWIDHSGFGSSPDRLNALFRLAFASAPPLNGLTSPARSNSPDHNAKGTQSETTASEDAASPPTACRHVVSGSISLASRRAFHLSLTVLVRYRSQVRISPWQMVLPASIGISRVPTYSGNDTQRHQSPSPTGLSPSLAALSSALRLDHSCPPRTLQDPPASPYNPVGTTAAAFYAPTVWALPRSLAATGGITVVSFSSGYLDVSVPLVRLVWAMYSPHDDRASPRPGFPIRTPMDQRSLAAPHGFSQLATSFLAVLCPGIHPAPLFA